MRWNNKQCLFYNFTFLFYLFMGSRQYSFEEIKVLLETTLEDINSVLFDSSEEHNKYYYQNFSGLSLRSLKYMNIYLNRTSTSHLFGGIIDSLIGKLSDSLTEYKSRNIFIDSLRQRGDEQQRQQDQIYHFMNTRNTLMPMECLSDYQNQKQRKQLEDFVQSMKKHTQPPKESKRSLILPKENKFQLKMGRKATFDSSALPIQLTNSMNNTYSNTPEEKIYRKDFQTQTEAFANQNEIINFKKCEIEIASQCDSYSVSEGLQDCFSQTKQKVPQIQKKKKKIPYQSQIKNKKKAKFNGGNLTSIKQDLNMQKKISKVDQSNTCSIKAFNSTSCMKLCSRQLQISVANYCEEATITVSFSNQRKKDTLASSKNIISYHEMQSSDRQQHKVGFTQNDEQFEPQAAQKQAKYQIKEVKQRIRLKYEQSKGDNMQPIHEVTNSFISFSSSYKQNTDYVQQLEESQIDNQIIFVQKPQKATSLHFQSQPLKLPISSVKILEAKQNKHQQPRQKSQFGNQIKNMNKIQKQQPIKKQSTIKKQLKISHPHAFYIDEKASQNIDNVDKINIINIIKPQQKIEKQRKSSDDQHSPSSRAKLQSQSNSSAPSQDYLAPRQIHSETKPIKSELKLRKSKLTALRKSQILQGQTGEQSPSSNSTQKLLNISKQKHLRPQSYDMGNSSGGLFVIANKNRLNSQAILKRNRDNNFNTNNESKRNSRKIKLNEVQQQIGLQDKIKENQSAKTSKNASVSQKTPKEFFQRSSQLLSEKSYLKKQFPKEQGKIFQSDYRKSLHQSSCENLMIKKGTRCLQSQIRSHSNSKSSAYYNAHSSPFEDDKKLPFQLCQLRSKLRNRAYKNKLAQYLQLIESTHKKFCGEGCIHLKQLLQGSNGDIGQNILRLFKKLK